MLPCVKRSICVVNSVLKTQLRIGSPSSVAPRFRTYNDRFEMDRHRRWPHVRTSQSSRKLDIEMLLMVTRLIFRSNVVTFWPPCAVVTAIWRAFSVLKYGDEVGSIKVKHSDIPELGNEGWVC